MLPQECFSTERTALPYRKSRAEWLLFWLIPPDILIDNNVNPAVVRRCVCGKLWFQMWAGQVSHPGLSLNSEPSQATVVLGVLPALQGATFKRLFPVKWLICLPAFFNHIIFGINVCVRLLSKHKLHYSYTKCIIAHIRQRHSLMKSFLLEAMRI